MQDKIYPYNDLNWASNKKQQTSNINCGSHSTFSERPYSMERYFHRKYEIYSKDNVLAANNLIYFF